MYEHVEDSIHAARLYVLHETDDTIPGAKRHMRVYVSFALIDINADFSRAAFTWERFFRYRCYRCSENSFLFSSSSLNCFVRLFYL